MTNWVGSLCSSAVRITPVVGMLSLALVVAPMASASPKRDREDEAAESKPGKPSEAKPGTLVLKTEFKGASDNLYSIALRHRPVSRENGPLFEDHIEKVLELEEAPDRAVAVPEAPVQSVAPAALSLAAGVAFEGPGLGMPGYVVGVAPPDSTMAVGPNHVVAWVNSHIAIFDKSGNTLLPGNGFVAGNSLFAGVGNVCESTNRGDPILQYDRLADRWVLSQFAFALSGGAPAAPYFQCFAISTSNDPTGTWYRYSVSFSATAPSGLNDYGKLGIWPDGYYASYNMFQGSPAGSNSGVALCASDRTKMLAGDPSASTLCAPIAFYAGGASFLPADLDGTTLPTDTSQGGIFIRQATAPALRLVKLKPNFAASTVTLTDGLGGAAGSFVNIPLPATPRACGGGTCIAQPGTAQTLDSLADRLMYRAAFRNRGGVESLVVTQSVDPDGAGGRSSAIRWYEIRNPLSSSPTLYQVGTYDPGASGDRWMGSVAMDGSGNILAGYSKVNAGASLKPSIAVAGRFACDPLHQLQGEATVITGTGSQTGGLSRWGDYSTMQVDPADDSTFWYITEYLSADGSFNWRTRIASYTLTGAASSPALAHAGAYTQGSSGNTITITPTNGPGTSGTVTLTDTPPTGLTITGVNTAGGWDCSSTSFPVVGNGSASVTCTIGAMTPNTAYPLVLDVTVAGDAGTPVVNTASVSGGNAFPSGCPVTDSIPVVSSTPQIINVGPTSASGSAPITWTAVNVTGNVEAWARPWPAGGWVLVETVAASAGTTSATYNFGTSGQQTELWVGANGGQIVGSAFNVAPGAPSVTNVGPTAASGAAPITWTAAGLSSVDAWARPLPGGAWTLVQGGVTASLGTTSSTYNFGSSGQQTEVWVGSGSVAATAVNTAAGTPSIANVQPTAASGPSVITWTAAGVSGNVEVWARPWPAGGWVLVQTVAASAGTTSSTYDFGSSGQQTELWVGGNGGQIVGSAINTAP